MPPAGCGDRGTRWTRAAIPCGGAAKAKTGAPEIVAAFDSVIVRAYLPRPVYHLHQRFLDENGQYLQDSGPILTSAGLRPVLAVLRAAGARPG